MASDLLDPPSRRGALKCLAFGGAGTLFALSGGVFTPIDLAFGATDDAVLARAGIYGPESAESRISRRACDPHDRQRAP